MLELQEIRLFPDPVLRLRGEELLGPDPHLAQRLRAALPPTAVGLAAPQIGASRRALIWRRDGREEILWNPLATGRGEVVLGQESCLSLPGEVYEVPRWREVSLCALSEDWQEITLELEGWMARVIQHEVDHLDGILISDRGRKF